MNFENNFYNKDIEKRWFEQKKYLYSLKNLKVVKQEKKTIYKVLISFYYSFF